MASDPAQELEQKVVLSEEISEMNPAGEIPGNSQEEMETLQDSEEPLFEEDTNRYGNSMGNQSILTGNMEDETFHIDLDRKAENLYVVDGLVYYKDAIIRYFTRTGSFTRRTLTGSHYTVCP